MNIISEKFNKKITGLRNNFQSNIEVNHQGVKGKLNEEELHNLIREVISKKYEVGSGIVVNSNGIQSNETDLFIYDESILPAFITNTITFVPIEAVKYVFEIKTTINPKEIQTTIDKFKHLTSLGYKGNKILFAFASNSKKHSELDRYKKYDDNNFFTNPTINIICVSNKAYYFHITNELYLKNFLSIEDIANHLGLGKKKMSESLNALEALLKNDDELDKIKRTELILLVRSVFQMDEILNKKIGNI